MRFVQVIFIIIIFTTIFTSCQQNKNEQDHNMLQKLDALLESDPVSVSDSLQSINQGTLSRENRAYYNLLKTISDDKNYVDFENDSTINLAVNYYQQHDPYSPEYIRSLIYKGIVRTRMGLSDSTVYAPLKKADNLYQKLNKPDPAIGYILYYFLGNTNYYNDNFDLANKYYQVSLDNAKLKNDSSRIFDAYIALFWNEMMQNKTENSRKYLDSVSYFYDKIPEKDYYILNAQSSYYESIGNLEKSIEISKIQLKIANMEGNSADASDLFFMISDRYKNLNLLDSALLYGQKAIGELLNINKKENHLFFENVAEIAEKQQNLLLANRYRNEAYRIYKNTINARLDTQVIELEKKYDLSEAENKALKSRQNSLLLTIFALILTMLFTMVVVLNLNIRRKAKERISLMQQEAKQKELEAKLMEEEANKRNWLIDIYGYISNRLTYLQDNFDHLSQKYINSNPKVYESMHQILHNIESDLREMPKIMTPDDDTFYLYTHLSKEEADLFNTNEKIILMLLTCKADNRQIATFMNTSLESIRARKSQLKRKMLEKGIKTDNIFEI